MLANLFPSLAALGLLLIGASGIETAILTGKDMFTKVAMSVLFTPFVLLGLIFAFWTISNVRNYMKGIDKETKQAIEKKEDKNALPPFRRFLVDFREHYADFFQTSYIHENEAIQQEATQIYRSLLGLRKERLKKLGVTLETSVKSMRYKRLDGISTHKFSDGKYDITEVEEEIVAKTSYRKDGKYIHNRIDKDLACYTIVHAKKVGEDTIICPNCGAEATRDELLDGCDYCHTKFAIEDLDQRVAEFAFRPDYDVAKARYNMGRNRVILMISGGVLGLLFFGILIFSLFQAPEMMAEMGVGIITIITSTLLGSIIGVAFIVPLVLFIFPFIIPALLGVYGGVNLISDKILKKLTESRKNDTSYSERIRQHDPNFSMINFYSNLQNKIATVIFADNRKQLEAFATTDLSALLSRYHKIINVETEYMGVTDYQVDDMLQHMQVEVSLKLTELEGEKVHLRNETWNLNLVKSADCLTQVLCAPVVTTCKSCGATLDLLEGKTCSYCDSELDMKQYDWVIENIQVEEEN